MRKVEKGKSSWGAQSAIREADEHLRFRTFTNFKHKDSNVNKWEAKSDKKPAEVRKSNKKFYCLDYNRGKCIYPSSHEGTFNRMQVTKLHMCRVCWERDGVEKHHPESSIDCPHKGAPPVKN